MYVIRLIIQIVIQILYHKNINTDNGNGNKNIDLFNKKKYSKSSI